MGSNEIELIPKIFKQQLRRPSTLSADLENNSKCKSSTTPSLTEFLTDLIASPNYDNNLFQFWLYTTIIKWLNNLTETNLFETDEYSVIILWLNKIFDILEKNQFLCFEEFFDYLLLDIKNLYNTYNIYGWDCLIPDSFEENYNVDEAEKKNDNTSISTNISVEYNLSGIDYELFLKRLDVLLVLTRQYFSSAFSFEIIQKAVQIKYYPKKIEAPHYLYFPKLFIPTGKPEKGKKDPLFAINEEALKTKPEKIRDFILPLSYSKDLTEEFWEELNKTDEEKPKNELN